MGRKIFLVSVLVAAACSGCSYLQTEASLDFYLRGQLEAERGHLPEALSNLSTAIKINPGMGEAYVARGDLYKKQGNYEQAADDFKKAADREPYNFDASFNLGLMSQYLKRFADAVKAYQQAVQIRPLDADANMNLAISYTQMGEPLRGLVYAQLSVKGNPDSAAAQTNLGVLYSQIGDHSDAISALKSAVELNAHQPEVYVDLANEYISNQQLDLAKNVLDTAATLAPSAMVQDRLGYIYYRDQDYGHANDAFESAIKLDPKYFQSLNGLGVVAMAQAISTTPPDVDLAKKGIDYWKQSLVIDSDQPKIQELLNKYTPHQ